MTLRSLVPMLRVTDLDQTVAFYQEALHCEITGRYQDDSGLQWAFVNAGPRDVVFVQADPAHTDLVQDKDIILRFFPGDVEAVHASLKAKNYPVSELQIGRHTGKACRVIDPDGYALWLEQAMEASGASREN